MKDAKNHEQPIRMIQLCEILLAVQCYMCVCKQCTAFTVI